jgi:hypothetical protein
MTLEDKIVALAQAVGADVRSLYALVSSSTGGGSGTSAIDSGIDGGAAATIYLSSQTVDGGFVATTYTAAQVSDFGGA